MSLEQVDEVPPLEPSDVLNLGTREARLRFACEIIRDLRVPRISANQAGTMLGWMRFAHEVAESMGEAAAHRISVHLLGPEGDLERVNDPGVFDRLEGETDDSTEH